MTVYIPGSMTLEIDNPRVGGGTDFCRSRLTISPGLSPRGRGTVVLALLMLGANGLSPRGRGNLPLPGTWRLRLGSIPAWAGEPVSIEGHEASIRVYPRVGGGTRYSRIASRTI